MIKVTIPPVPAKTVNVSRCFYDCPYFSTVGHEMQCTHPNKPKGLLLYHPDVMKFPKGCPIK
jgi:hypothetical protein